MSFSAAPKQNVASSAAIEKLAVYYQVEAYTTATKQLVGRRAAGAGFLKALAEAQPRELWCHTGRRAAAEAFAREVRSYGAQSAQLHWVPFTKPGGLEKAGILYRPDPGIEKDAWRRLQHSSPGGYSICGITHTTAMHQIMDEISGLVTGPTEEWDAVICTSVAVRDMVRVILSETGDYLRERFGPIPLKLPQLPVIPLGVHCDEFVAGEAERAAARAALGLAPDEVAVVYVGRLSFTGKIHPMPMFLGLEACSDAARIVLIQAGWFPDKTVKLAFQEAASKLCPSVRCIYLDGRDPETKRRAWVAADIFSSLSDNIQETFGLTPVEAMAAGLPVVVSDWNGYRDTARDGTDGFRIPTLSMAPGSGGDFADRYDAKVDSYEQYIGTTSQLVAVDVRATADAFRRLTTDPDLRRRMGEAGRRRARENFDWKVIMAQYGELWAELSARRASAPIRANLSKRRRPSRQDPFTLFAGYPTTTIGLLTPLELCAAASGDLARTRRDLESVRFAARILPPDDFIETLLTSTRFRRTFTPSDVAREMPDIHPARLQRWLAWMVKAGLVYLAGI
jgi:starch synthase